jgi:hypothetical protein
VIVVVHQFVRFRSVGSWECCDLFGVLFIYLFIYLLLRHAPLHYVIPHARFALIHVSVNSSCGGFLFLVVSVWVLRACSLQCFEICGNYEPVGVNRTIPSPFTGAFDLQLISAPQDGRRNYP